jgi:hypothetical protein
MLNTVSIYSSINSYKEGTQGDSFSWGRSMEMAKYWTFRNKYSQNMDVHSSTKICWMDRKGWKWWMASFGTDFGG